MIVNLCSVKAGSHESGMLFFGPRAEKTINSIHVRSGASKVRSESSSV